ncbi:hypothetical protein [Methylobacterium planeticum]|uniref:Uncharacterized protein n=1 Tax=Methylobacterium planeticum TaxID=2615211 RepID=A0A6N6MS92_9HYPH|nr:hypothetical protein [Methylobacterium planeticum]KAB1072261.1 hypothetical protein F6X51_16240 [Methylobacterium planeticum]
MDVVLNPIGSDGLAWSLKDRLGRPLGKVESSGPSGGYEIIPEEGSPLQGVVRLHASLDAIMAAIERQMGGPCQINSGDWT